MRHVYFKFLQSGKIPRLIKTHIHTYMHTCTQAAPSQEFCSTLAFSHVILTTSQEGQGLKSIISLSCYN